MSLSAPQSVLLRTFKMFIAFMHFFFSSLICERKLNFESKVRPKNLVVFTMGIFFFPKKKVLGLGENF